MPELPEVEFARRQMERFTHHKKIKEVETEKNCRLFRDSVSSDFNDIKGQLVFAKRKGKQLWFQFSKGKSLLMHLGMTGKFLKRPKGELVKFSKCRFTLDSGEVIHFCDMRMFGKVDAVESSKAQHVFDELGLDVLSDSVTGETLKSALANSKQELKVALMDQSKVAGLGNIHVVEALFRAQLSPFLKPGALTDAQWKHLAKGINDSIAFALKSNGEGDEIIYVEEGGKNPFRIYGREGSPCIKCKSAVQAVVQAQRTTHFCAKCQHVKRSSS
jgi:formamidopyrimidine-DNA glycosylase